MHNDWELKGKIDKNQCKNTTISFNHPQITPSLIPDLPSNIVQFVCGAFLSLFLDSEGNVFSVGSNSDGKLGLGNVIHHSQFQFSQK